MCSVYYVCGMKWWIETGRENVMIHMTEQKKKHNNGERQENRRKQGNNSTRENMRAEKKSTRVEHPRKENKGNLCSKKSVCVLCMDAN